MIENGADVNASELGGNKWTPLIYASRYGYKDIVELLIAKGANLNARAGGGDKHTPLINALRCG